MAFVAARRKRIHWGRHVEGYLVIAPWLIRNWLVFGAPILTTTHGGYTLLLGNNEVFDHQVIRQPWGTVWQGERFDHWQSNLESEIDRDLGRSATELERDRWHSQRAKQFIMSHPRQFVHAAVYRIESLWNTVPLAETADGANSWILAAVGWYYSVVLTVYFVGMVMVSLRPNAAQWIPLYILVVSIQLAHLFYWTNTRMRAPLTPVIALFAFAALPRSRSDQTFAELHDGDLRHGVQI